MAVRDPASRVGAVPVDTAALCPPSQLCGLLLQGRPAHLQARNVIRCSGEGRGRSRKWGSNNLKEIV